MLAAVSDHFALLIVVISAIAAILSLIRGAEKLKDSLEVRDGRVALKEEAKAKLAKRGFDIEKIETFIAKTYAVNEQGHIVERKQGVEMEATTPAASASEPDIFTPTEPGSAREPDDRFRSVWEEQDQGPSIWDDKERAEFWGEDEKRQR